MDENRLDRIEQKLDKLTEIMIALAKMETGMKTIFNRHDLLEGRLNEQSKRVRTLEDDSTGRKAIMSRLERFIWILLAALVGFIVYYVQAMPVSL